MNILIAFLDFKNSKGEVLKWAEIAIVMKSVIKITLIRWPDRVKVYYHLIIDAVCLCLTYIFEW